MLRAVRAAGLRVAEAQRAEHHPVVQDRHDQRGLWRQLLLEARERAAAGTVVVVNTRAQDRSSRSRDEGHRARQVVAANRVRGDEAPHVAGKPACAMRRAHTPKRALVRHVNEAEISETGKGFASFAIEHAHVTSTQTADFQVECNDLRVRHQAQRPPTRSATVRG